MAQRYTLTSLRRKHEFMEEIRRQADSISQQEMKELLARVQRERLIGAREREERRKAQNRIRARERRAAKERTLLIQLLYEKAVTEGMTTVVSSPEMPVHE